VILEAASHVGGRTYTIDQLIKCQSDEVRSESESQGDEHSQSQSSSQAFGIDTGAQWIHGKVGNPVYSLAFERYELEKTCGGTGKSVWTSTR